MAKAAFPTYFTKYQKQELDLAFMGGCTQEHPHLCKQLQ